MAQAKPGRNDPCHCGSGIKYKSCHLDRDKGPAVSQWDVERELQKSFSRRVCMHPDASPTSCRGGVINAHTVRRAADLSRIARDGHVYGIVADLKSLSRDSGKLKPRLVGVNRASTFGGFCALHDRELFAPLETEEFAGSPKQLHRLHYRAIALELYKKGSLKNAFPFMRQSIQGLSPRYQASERQYFDSFEAGVDGALKEMSALKLKLDAGLKAEDYGPMRGFIFDLDQTPDILCAGGTQPDIDFQGNALQDLSRPESPAKLITFSLLAVPGGGRAVFAWHEKDRQPAERLLRSLLALPRQDIPHALVRYAFECLENLYLRPEWWEALRPSDQEIIFGHILSGTPGTDVQSHLQDDGMRAVDWAVTKISRLDGTGLLELGQ